MRPPVEAVREAHPPEGSGCKGPEAERRGNTRRELVRVLIPKTLFP